MARANNQSDNKKEEKTSKYVVATRKGFPYPSRVRSGITFTSGDTEVELTKDQVKAIKADPELTLREAGKKEEKTNDDANKESLRQAKDRPSGYHGNVVAGYNGPGQVPANPDSPDSDSTRPQSSAGRAPQGASEPQGSGEQTSAPADRDKRVAALLKKNSQEALLEQAKSAKVDVPEGASKKQVAEALIDAQKE